MKHTSSSSCPLSHLLYITFIQPVDFTLLSLVYPLISFQPSSICPMHCREAFLLDRRYVCNKLITNSSMLLLFHTLLGAYNFYVCFNSFKKWTYLFDNYWGIEDTDVIKTAFIVFICWWFSSINWYIFTMWWYLLSRNRSLS